MDYNIKLNEKQLLALINATDFLSRIESGQLSEILHKGIPIQKNVNRGKIRELLGELKKEMFPELSTNSSYGIFSKELSENPKILYDIHQAMRYTYSWKTTPEGGFQTWFDKPFQSSKEDLPEVTTVDIASLLDRAKKDLSMWLYYAGVDSLEEFYKRNDEIKENSFHKHNDVMDHLKYIEKLKLLKDRRK